MSIASFLVPVLVVDLLCVRIFIIFTLVTTYAHVVIHTSTIRSVPLVCR